MQPPPHTKTALPIQIRALTKRYEGRFALNALDLDVHSGEFLTVLGPSGSGKTTLLMAIAGFTRPDAGDIRFGETEVTFTPPHKRNVGVVFQDYALFPHMTVADNIAFPLKLRGVGGTERRARVAEALDTVQLSGLDQRNVDELSGGQRQRVALARAFVFKPRILLMDEPLSALDRELRDRMQLELKQLHRALGVTTVYVTHDQREALTMSDRIAVMHEGELMQLGPPEEVYNRPRNAFVAGFVGESTMIPLQTDSAGDFVFQNQKIGHVAAADAGQNWSLVARPERLYFAKQVGRSDTDQIVFKGVLKEIVFQGESKVAIVEIDALTRLSVRFGPSGQASGSDLRIGTTVAVGLSRQDAIFVPAEVNT